MQCFSIAPIITLCLLWSAIAVGFNFYSVGIDRNYAVKSIFEIHKEIQSKTLKSVLYVIGYPLVLFLFLAAAWPLRVLFTSVAIEAIALWGQHVACT